MMVDILLTGLKCTALMGGILVFIFAAVVVLNAICKAVEVLTAGGEENEPSQSLRDSSPRGGAKGVTGEQDNFEENMSE